MCPSFWKMWSRRDEQTNSCMVSVLRTPPFLYSALVDFAPLFIASKPTEKPAASESWLLHVPWFSHVKSLAKMNAAQRRTSPHMSHFLVYSRHRIRKGGIHESGEPNFIVFTCWPMPKAAWALEGDHNSRSWEQFLRNSFLLLPSASLLLWSVWMWTPSVRIFQRLHCGATRRKMKRDTSGYRNNSWEFFSIGKYLTYRYMA